LAAKTPVIRRYSGLGLWRHISSEKRKASVKARSALVSGYAGFYIDLATYFNPTMLSNIAGIAVVDGEHQWIYGNYHPL